MADYGPTNGEPLVQSQGITYRGRYHNAPQYVCERCSTIVEDPDTHTRHGIGGSTHRAWKDPPDFG